MKLAEFRQRYPQYDDVPDHALASRLHARFYPDVPRAEFDAQIGLAPPERTFGEAASDLGVSFAGGAGAMVENLGQVGALVTGGGDNTLTEAGASAREFWAGRKSPGLQAREQRRAQAIESADGVVDQALTAARETLLDPAMLSSWLAEQAPMLMPSAVAGRVAGAGAAALGAGASTAGRVATGTAVGTGAVQQGADVGGDAYQSLLTMPPELWNQNAAYLALRESGADDATARHAVALELARDASVKSALVSAATNLIPGARVLERALVGAKSPSAGKLRSMIQGALGEAAQEMTEEGAGKALGNVARQGVDPSIETSEGVGEAIGMAVPAGLFGAAGGLAAGGAAPQPSPPAPPPAPGAPQAAPPAAPAPTAPPPPAQPASVQQAQPDAAPAPPAAPTPAPAPSTAEIRAPSGEAFATQRSAELHARMKGISGYHAAQTEDGWILRRDGFTADLGPPAFEPLRPAPPAPVIPATEPVAVGDAPAMGTGAPLPAVPAAVQAGEVPVAGTAATLGEGVPPLAGAPAVQDGASPSDSGLAQREPQFDQAGRDRVLADANLFGDSADAETIQAHGFDSLQRDRQAMVLSKVVSGMNDQEVLRAVIETVPVDVMNVLVGPKWSAESLLHDPSVLAHRLSVPSDVPVPEAVSRFVDSLAAEIKGVTTLLTAEEPRLPTPVAPATEGRAAVGARPEGGLDAGAGTENSVRDGNMPASQPSEGSAAGVASQGETLAHAVGAGQPTEADVTPPETSTETPSPDALTPAERRRAEAADRARAARLKERQVAKDDDLLAAIAKLGGLQRDNAESEGVDPAEFDRRGYKIYRVFTKAGVPADEMMQRLEDAGFDFEGYDGVGYNRLWRALDDALRGKQIRTDRGLEDAVAARIADFENAAIQQYEEALADQLADPRDDFDPGAMLADEGEYGAAEDADLYARRVYELALRADAIEDGAGERLVEDAARRDLDDEATVALLEEWIRDRSSGVGVEAPARAQGPGPSAASVQEVQGADDGRPGRDPEPRERTAREEVAAGPDDDVPFSRRGMGGMTREAVAAAIDPMLARWANAPRVHVVDTVVQLIGRTGIRRIPFDADGMWHDGAAWLVAENLTDAARAQRVLIHEAVGHGGLRAVLGDRLVPVLDQVLMAHQAGRLDGVGPTLAELARKYELDLSRREHRLLLAEEYLAVTAEMSEPPARLQAILDRLYALIREALRALSPQLELGTSEIRDLLARARAHVEGRGAGAGSERAPAFSRDTMSDDERLVTAWEELAALDDVQQYPRAQARTPPAIADELNLGITIEPASARDIRDRTGADPDGRRMWFVQMPDETFATLHEDGREVWIDAAALDAGTSRGSALYHIAASYAHNTGKVFVADPGGLSPQAQMRRTEHMIASALKYGTTRHLAPGERQKLRWKAGDDVRNLAGMLRASFERYAAAYPKIRDVIYNPERDRFEDATDGREFTDADFRDLAEAGARGTSPAGRATLKRAAVSNTLLRGEGEPARRRQGVLRGDVQLGDQRTAPHALTSILYSRARGDDRTIDLFGPPASQRQRAPERATTQGDMFGAATPADESVSRRQALDRERIERDREAARRADQANRESAGPLFERAEREESGQRELPDILTPVSEREQRKADAAPDAAQGAPLAAYRNEEDGTEARIVRHDSGGFSVTLWDTDADAALPEARIFPDMARADAYARSLVAAPGTRPAVLTPVSERDEPRFSRAASDIGAAPDEGTAPAGAPISHDDFAAENRRIREQDRTLWNKAKKLLRRNFASGGLLPQVVFDEKIARDSQFEVVEFDIRHLIGVFERAVKAAYGRSMKKLDAQTQDLLRAGLAGRPDPSLPESLRVPLLAMRQYIDILSEHYVEILEAQAEALRAQGKDGAARADLIDTIRGNMGEYVHRSYRAFDDPKWPTKVPDEVLNAAREYLVQRHVTNGESMPEAKRLAEVALHEILKNGTAYESMEGFIKESKLGAKDLSVLRRRQEIAPEIRALLGEYTDPRLNFAKSATKMGRLIWNQKFLDKVREQGMGVFLFEGTDRPPEATVQIAAESSSAYEPLNGLWTFPEVDQAFRDALDKEQMANWYRTIVQLNGIVKFGKTVLSPTTAMRNWQSAFFFTLANGHLDLRHAAKSLSGLREYFTQRGSDARLAYLIKLKELGVVYDTPYAGEMMRLLEDSRIEEQFLHGDAKLKFKEALGYAQKFYQFGDDFWKIIGFENEKQLLMKHAGLDLAAAEKEAAARIRNTYPTYSMIGRVVKALRRFPLVGTFVSFPAEIIRTSYHMVRYAAQDMQTPGMRPLAMRRIAGLAAAAGFAYALQELTKALLDVDDDEEEAVRRLSAPWSRNSNILFLGRQQNGDLRYIDLSFLDPYNYWKRPLTAVLRDQPWQQKAAQAAGELLEPFLGTDIAAGALYEVMSNKKESGGRVFNENDRPHRQLTDILDHLRKSLQPGVAANIERTIRAVRGEVSRSGRTFDLGDEMAAWGGWRVTTLDPKVSLYYRTYEFNDMKRDATASLNVTLRDPNPVSDRDIEAAFGRAMRIRRQAYEDMFLIIESARKSGVSRLELIRVLLSSGVSRTDIAFLMQGKMPPWIPTRSSVAGARRKADALFGSATGTEFARRYTNVARLARDVPADELALSR